MGDSRASDVAGTNAAGLRSVLYAPDGDDAEAGRTDGAAGDDAPNDRITSLPALRSVSWVA